MFDILNAIEITRKELLVELTNDGISKSCVECLYYQLCKYRNGLFSQDNIGELAVEKTLILLPYCCSRYINKDDN